MNFGVGTDMADISRFEKLLRDAAFAERVYTVRELQYINGRPATAAGIFCAKEALAKSLGIGVFAALRGAAEIFHEESGRPYIVLAGDLADRCAGCAFDLSITHTDSVAAATVIWSRVC